MQNSHLKIIYNEECVDLRAGLEPAMRNRMKMEESFDPGPRTAKEERNEVVNTALKKLAKTYNAKNPRWKPRVRERTFDVPLRRKLSGVQDADLKSKSELSTVLKKQQQRGQYRRISPSSPVIQSSNPCDRGDVSKRVEPYKNTFTMTKPASADREETGRGKGKKLIKDKSLEKLLEQLATDKSSLLSNEVSRHPCWNDQRLIEKYSLLKIPWKRSHTLPICFSKPSLTLKQEFLKKLRQQCDKKTYLYDDGTDIDSTLHVAHKIDQQYFGHTFQAQLLTLLNISAYICALLVLLLIVWLMSGNKLYKLLVPQPPESPLKRYIKYVGGGIFYTISSIIRFIGRIFSIPTHQVYQPATDYSWPPLA